MSALGGIYSYGEKIDEQVLSSLGESLSVRGIDGGAEVALTHVGFSYRALHTNPESRLEQQPFVSPARHVIVWDGRLDNSEEVLRQLRDHSHITRSTVTDVEIVMAAYMKWGEGFVSRLIGDFALALWDPHARTVVLARDPAGTRTLYYHNNGKRFVWASDLRSLMPLVGTIPEVEDDYVAGFLTMGAELHLTPYKEVFAVQPGEMLVVSPDRKVKAERFWSPDPKAEVLYKSDAEYEEHFRYLFREAVRCRLRSDSPVFAELSGGLDSSSIVCMADTLLGSGHSLAPELVTISTVADGSPTSSERRFINMVETYRGQPTNFVREDEFPILSPVPDFSLFWTLNSMVNGYARHQAFANLLISRNARVLLSGIGGDELIHSTNDPNPELSDLLSSARFLTLHRRLNVWGPLLQESYLRLLWRGALLPSCPRRVRAFFRNAYGWEELFSLFNPEFTKVFRLRERLLGSNDVFGYRTPGGRSRSIAFMGAVRSVAVGTRQETCAYDVTYPCLDRRVVEFLLSVPYEQLVRPGESRSLMRRALVGVLPEGIRRRRGKGNPSETVCRAIAREWGHLGPMFESPRVVSRGYMRAGPLHDAFNRVRLGCPAGSGLLLSVIALEIWLRCLDDRVARENFSPAAVTRRPQLTRAAAM